MAKSIRSADHHDSFPNQQGSGR
ncbi:hypothetical protein EMIT0215P_590002 [Pseudomonas serboccidentalis]